MTNNNEGNSLIKSPQDFAGGLVMVVIGLGAWFFARDLKLGTGANLGPGTFPIGISILIALLGALLMFYSTRKEGEALDWRFLRMLALLTVFAVIFYVLTLTFDAILAKLGVSSKQFPWSTLLPAIVIVGLVFYIVNLSKTDETVARYVMRGPIFIITAICIFALLIRPMGLVVAGFAMIVLAVNSSEEVDWKETLIFATVMTAVCVVLFRYMLKQAIPILPWLNI